MQDHVGRPLGSIESTFALANEIAPFAAAGAAEIRGKLDGDRLRASLTRLQARHPVLRVRIATDGKRRQFVTDGVGEIPLRVAFDDWATAFEQALNTRIDAERGPLLRCTFVAEDEGGRILLAFHHAIADGASAMRLLDELLRLCADPSAPDAPSTTTLPVSADDRVPPASRTPGRVVSYLIRQVGEDVRYARGTPTTSIGAPGARTRLHALTVPPETTAGLRRAARKRHVVSNAALCAAMLLALSRTTGHRGVRRCMSYADARRYLQPPLDPDSLGCHVSILTAPLPITDDVWEMADVLQHRLYRSAKRGDKFLSIALSERLGRLAKTTGRAARTTVALSYLGNTGLPRDYGSFEVASLFGGVSTAANMIQPHLAGVAVLFDGALHWSILHSDAALDEPTARATVEELERVVDEMAGASRCP